MKNFLLSLCCTLLLSSPAMAGLIELPAPQKDSGIPLMQAFAQRHSERQFSSQSLPLQEVSNILWAACGISRQDGKRTIPTAMNYQRIAVYAVLSDGVYRYDADQNILEPVLDGNYLQLYSNGAPLILLHTAQENDRFSACHIGSMYQNVALYCASAGLANVMKAQETHVLDGKLPLPEGYRVFMIQPIGYPKSSRP
jgi:hypothetical protein